MFKRDASQRRIEPPGWDVLSAGAPGAARDRGQGVPSGFVRDRRCCAPALRHAGRPACPVTSCWSDVAIQLRDGTTIYADVFRWWTTSRTRPSRHSALTARRSATSG